MFLMRISFFIARICCIGIEMILVFGQLVEAVLHKTRFHPHKAIIFLNTSIVGDGPLGNHLGLILI